MEAIGEESLESNNGFDGELELDDSPGIALAESGLEENSELADIEATLDDEEAIVPGETPSFSVREL